MEVYGLFADSSGHKAKKELRLRPQFPAFYRESEISDVNIVSEVIAVADVRRVGDLVDWFSDSCYWSGTITEIKDDGKVQVILLVHFSNCAFYVCCCIMMIMMGIVHGSMPMLNYRKLKG